MSTVSPDSVAQDQIKAFVERIERLEEERKAIARDIAEVYAEAKGNGFDRKALKQVVRIRSMDHSARMELEALVDLYLSALGMASSFDAFDDDDERRSHVHVHVREEQPNHDPETGEIIETSRHGAGGAEDLAQVATVRASSSAQPLQQDSAEVARGAHNPEVAGSIPAPATTSEPASPPSEIAEPGDRGAVVPSAAPVVAEPNDYTKPNPWCLDQEECGLSSWDHFCLRCQRVKAERQAVEAVQ